MFLLIFPPEGGFIITGSSLIREPAGTPDQKSASCGTPPLNMGYCARGNCENAIKAVKNDLHSDRTSATSFLANAMRLLLACAAYVLHHALRTHTLQHTALAQAQPSTVILTLFKIATQLKQYKDRILLHLPSSCPVKALLQRVTTLLCAVPEPVCNTS